MNARDLVADGTTNANTGGWLIYHPRRKVSQLGNLIVYHDSLEGNQDPYVWNRQFLHTACHITQMTSEVGNINFWVSGDTWPKFAHLSCDLVFVVQSKTYWKNANDIAPDDPLVDSPRAFADHYTHMPKDHPYAKLRRFTLKADPDRSFQPQCHDHSLIDIVPTLEAMGLSLDSLREGLRAGYGAKPLRLSSVVTVALYNALSTADIRLTGRDLEGLRP